MVINYTVNPSMPPSDRPSAWDIELKLEDVALKSKMQGVSLNASRDTLRELTKLDDEVGLQNLFLICFSLILVRRLRRWRNLFSLLY